MWGKAPICLLALVRPDLATKCPSAAFLTRNHRAKNVIQLLAMDGVKAASEMQQHQ